MRLGAPSIPRFIRGVRRLLRRAAPNKRVAAIARISPVHTPRPNLQAPYLPQIMRVRPQLPQAEVQKNEHRLSRLAGYQRCLAADSMSYLEKTGEP